MGDFFTLFSSETAAAAAAATSRDNPHAFSSLVRRGNIRAPSETYRTCCASACNTLLQVDNFCGSSATNDTAILLPIAVLHIPQCRCSETKPLQVVYRTVPTTVRRYSCGSHLKLVSCAVAAPQRSGAIPGSIDGE